VPVARKLTVGKISNISIYQRTTGRWIVSWYDEHGTRRNPSFATLKEAEAFQKQKRAELDRHRETRFDLDDKQMYSLARDLTSSHGYTILQAVQEWHRAKAFSNGLLLGEVIEKFLGAKASHSSAYTDKLNADILLVKRHFGADRPIDRIRSDEIEDFWTPKKAAGRRRNNLRSELIISSGTHRTGSAHSHAIAKLKLNWSTRSKQRASPSKHSARRSLRCF